MPFPKLSPLQSRLAASIGASFMLLMLYFTLSSPRFAYASEIDAIEPEDHNHNRLLDALNLRFFGGDDDDEDGFGEDLEDRDVTYESEFFGVQRSIIGRVPSLSTELENNIPSVPTIDQGAVKYFYFSNKSVWGTKSPETTGLPSPVRLRRRDDEEMQDLEDYTEEDRWVPDDDQKEVETDDELRLRPRQSSTDSKMVYISINTCKQPVASSNKTTVPPPQLELYISTSDDNQYPAANSTGDQAVVTVDGGAGMLSINVTANVYIGVSAPNSTEFNGTYEFQVAASIDAFYHYFDSADANLHLIDSDGTSALLVTNNLTSTSPNSTVYKEWMSIEPPFVMFASNQDSAAILGVQNSYCGLENYADIAATKGGVETETVHVGMTSRGLGNLPKQQFYFDGLNKSSSYFGILAMNGNSTAEGNGVVGGGGKVWQTMNFTTLSDGNCAVIFDLEFCDQVAYAVPGNTDIFPDYSKLAAFYDNSTQDLYQNFDYSLQQIACNTTSSAQYSLARTCDDCASAYKEWLCSVRIPRCTDFSSDLPWLQERNVGQPYPNGTQLDQIILDTAKDALYINSSRNTDIDSVVQPGPYKETLPCQELCWNIVQSCPAAFGFGCPSQGAQGFSSSYGTRPDGSAAQSGQITCNYPGAAYFLSAGHINSGTGSLWSALSAVVALAFLL